MRKLLLLVALLVVLVSIAPLASAKPAAQFAGCADEEARANGFTLRAVGLNGVQMNIVVVGVDDFDPAVTIMTEEGEVVNCSNDSGDAEEVSFTLPSLDEEQVAGPSELSASSGFTVDSDERKSYDIIVTGNEGSMGEFVLLLYGASVFPAGDYDNYQIITSQAMNDAEVPIAIYVANLDLPENPLNPEVRVAVGEDFKQECRASSSDSLCDGDSEDLTGYTVTLEADEDPITLTGNDVVLAFAAGGDEPVTLDIEARSSGGQSTGPYGLIIHSGVGEAPEAEAEATPGS